MVVSQTKKLSKATKFDVMVVVHKERNDEYSCKLVGHGTQCFYENTWLLPTMCYLP